MQIVSGNNVLRTSGNIGETTAFTIAANGKMFKTISNTLYSDKVGSMIRELSCNAMDAHIAAGFSDLPFVIHLPNAIEPWFSVKDEGIGLSDDDVRHLYTTFGQSTKDQSNDMVGCFGFGSKTPFAYTDQFTITSIFEGMKRIYTAALNPEGLPVLNLQVEELCFDHAGLEVSVSVNGTDFIEFRNSVVNQLQFFKIKPKLINNMSCVQFKDMTHGIQFQNDDITVYGSKNDSAIRSGVYIVQGGVGYPLDHNKLKLATEDQKKFISSLGNSGAFITVPIGTIGMTPSRESIEYDNRTSTNILNLLTRITTSMTTTAVAELQAEPYVWNRCIIFNNQIEPVRHGITVARLPIVKTLLDDAGASYNTYSRHYFMSVPLVGFHAKGYQRKDIWRRRNGTGSDWVMTATRINDNSMDGSYLIKPTNIVTVVVKDTKNRPIMRLRKLLTGNHPEWKIVYVEGYDGSFVNPSDEPVIAAALGLPASAIVRLSSLDIPITTPSTTRKATMPTAWLYDKNCMISASMWKGIYEDIKTLEAIYVVVERKEFALDHEYVRAVLLMAKDGKLTMPVIAVNTKTYERIVKGKTGMNLVSAKSVIEEMKDEAAKLAKVYVRYMTHKALFMDLNRWDIAKRFPEVLEVSKKNNMIKRMGIQHKLDKNAIAGMETYLNTLVKPKDYGAAVEVFVGKLMREVFQKYPMLQLISYVNSENVPVMKNYITEMNQLKGLDKDSKICTIEDVTQTNTTTN